MNPTDTRLFDAVLELVFWLGALWGISVLLIGLGLFFLAWAAVNWYNTSKFKRFEREQRKRDEKRASLRSIDHLLGQINDGGTTANVRLHYEDGTAVDLKNVKVRIRPQ